MLGLKPLSNAPSLHLEQLKMTAKIGASLAVDGAAFHSDGNVAASDGVELRRARISAQGDCILIFPVSYQFEVGYVPREFYLNQAWLSSERYDYVGYLVAGVFGPPMGLDLQTSSRDLTFLEPATVLQALAPGNQAGIQIGHPVFDQRGAWALGIFGGGLLFTEYGNASQDFGNLIGRFTYLAIDHPAPPDHPTENRLLHLAAC
jgi:phosphate-selective porin